LPRSGQAAQKRVLRQAEALETTQRETKRERERERETEGGGYRGCNNTSQQRRSALAGGLISQTRLKTQGTDREKESRANTKRFAIADKG
jgi:hypothetical protein